MVGDLPPRQRKPRLEFLLSNNFTAPKFVKYSQIPILPSFQNPNDSCSFFKSTIAPITPTNAPHPHSQST
jgi:hypothetical protein